MSFEKESPHLYATPMTSEREQIHSARTILFTDIVGSTRFFASHGDAAGLDMLKRHNQYLFPVIKSANGRIIKTIGDSIMAVFEYPTDALKAAFSMQSKLAKIRQRRPDDKDMHIRIGIHYGLVSEAGNDVFGDAVNIADRIKSKAGPDAIVISHTLRDLIRVDRRFDFKAIGKSELKGAAEPMELFELTMAPEVREHSSWGLLEKRTVKVLRKQTVAIPLILLIALAAFLVKLFLVPPAYDAIAVMPFQNISNDPKTDYLSIAMASELDTQLLKIKSLVIRPLNITLPYKGKTWTPKEVADRLKVSKIIRGSFVRGGDELRVNVTIIDVAHNKQILVEPSQGRVSDTLDLLDQTARQVANALRLQVMNNRDIFKYGTENISAYNEYLMGLSSLYGKMTEENNRASIEMFESAVGLDPKFARAYASLALAYAMRFWWNFSNNISWLDKAEQTARKSLALDKNLIEGHYALAYTLESEGRIREATKQYLTCFRLDQRYVPALTYMARYAFYMGEFDMALDILERIARIDPTQNIQVRRAINLFFAGRIKEGLEANRRAEDLAQGVDQLTFVGITYVWLGDIKSAERVLKTLTRAQPQALSIRELKAWIYTAQGKYKEAQEEMKHFQMRKSWGIMQEMAALYALQGEKDKALHWLEKAVSSGGPSYAWFKSDQFKILRDDPRYQEIIKKMDDKYAPLRAEFKELLSRPHHS